MTKAERQEYCTDVLTSSDGVTHMQAEARTDKYDRITLSVAPRSSSSAKAGGSLFGILRRNLVRRQRWLLPHLTIRKFFNLAVAVLQFAYRARRVWGYPVVLKIDLTPLCNLHCPACVHATPAADSRPELRNQKFKSRQLMTVDQFQTIVSEVKGKTMALSLYYLGDPLVHPNLAEFCAIAARARINTHISSNFSFRLSDEKLRNLVTSGLTHLTVCVDGFTQYSYQQARTGGDLRLVLQNLERIIQIRNKHCQRWPLVEVQYLTYPHNIGDLPLAREYFERIGVDVVSVGTGNLDNWAAAKSDLYGVRAARKDTGLFPCSLPYFMMVVKYDGNAIPCCSHRLGAQYSDGDMRTVGNVFRDGVRAVWNGSDYARNRRIVASPKRALTESQARKHFCYACPSLYEFDDTPLSVTNLVQLTNGAIGVPLGSPPQEIL